MNIVFWAICQSRFFYFCRRHWAVLSFQPTYSTKPWPTWCKVYIQETSGAGSGPQNVVTLRAPLWPVIASLRVDYSGMISKYRKLGVQNVHSCIVLCRIFRTVSHAAFRSKYLRVKLKQGQNKQINKTQMQLPPLKNKYKNPSRSNHNTLWEVAQEFDWNPVTVRRNLC